MGPSRLRQRLAAVLAGQQLHFPPVYPFPTPRPACAVIVGYPSDSFSPNPPESAKQKKEKKTPNSNQIRLFEPPRPPPRPTQTPPYPPPRPHPPPGRSGARPWEPRGSPRRGRCDPSSRCSCRSGSARWCPPAGPPMGCGCGGLR